MKYKYGIDENGNDVIIHQPDGIVINMVGVNLEEISKDLADEKLKEKKQKDKEKKDKVDKNLDKDI